MESWLAWRSNIGRRDAKTPANRARIVHVDIETVDRQSEAYAEHSCFMMSRAPNVENAMSGT
jgi:hypothetical protein